MPPSQSECPPHDFQWHPLAEDIGVCSRCGAEGSEFAAGMTFRNRYTPSTLTLVRRAIKEGWWLTEPKPSAGKYAHSEDELREHWERIDV